MTAAQKTVAKKTRTANAAATVANKGKTTPAVKATPTKGKTKGATVAAPKPLFHIKDSFRHASGAALFAYTAAWLQETGLIDGGNITRETAVKFAGATAVGYHVNKTGRFVETKEGRIALAPNAANFFLDRNHPQEIREAFRKMIQTGTPDGTLIKQASAFAPIPV